MRGGKGYQVKSSNVNERDKRRCELIIPKDDGGKVSNINIDMTLRDIILECLWQYRSQQTL